MTTQHTTRADDLGPTHPTTWWHTLPDGRVQCDVCPRECRLHEGQRGLCFVRARRDGQIVSTTYGHWTSGEEPYVVNVRFRMDELDDRLPVSAAREPASKSNGPPSTGAGFKSASGTNDTVTSVTPRIGMVSRSIAEAIGWPERNARTKMSSAIGNWCSIFLRRDCAIRLVGAVEVS